MRPVRPVAAGPKSRTGRTSMPLKALVVARRGRCGRSHAPFLGERKKGGGMHAGLGIGAAPVLRASSGRCRPPRPVAAA